MLEEHLCTSPLNLGILFSSSPHLSTFAWGHRHVRFAITSLMCPAQEIVPSFFFPFSSCVVIVYIPRAGTTSYHFCLARNMLLASTNIDGVWKGGREVMDPNAAVCARATRGHKDPGRAVGDQQPRNRASCCFLPGSPHSHLTQTKGTQNKMACTTQKEGTLLGHGEAEAVVDPSRGRRERPARFSVGWRRAGQLHW